jgi:hypothetical protein
LLACPTVRHDLVGYGLVLAEVAKPGALDGTDMNEDVLGAIVRLDEAVALG